MDLCVSLLGSGGELRRQSQRAATALWCAAGRTSTIFSACCTASCDLSNKLLCAAATRASNVRARRHARTAAWLRRRTVPAHPLAGIASWDSMRAYWRPRSVPMMRSTIISGALARVHGRLRTMGTAGSRSAADAARRFAKRSCASSCNRCSYAKHSIGIRAGGGGLQTSAQRFRAWCSSCSSVRACCRCVRASNGDGGAGAASGAAVGKIHCSVAPCGSGAAGTAAAGGGTPVLAAG